MLKMQRILSLLIIAVLLTLTACSTPERVSSPSPAPTASPTATATPTPMPSPTASLSQDEVVELLDSFVVDLFSSQDFNVKCESAFGDDMYIVYVTWGDPVDSLFVAIQDNSLDDDIHMEALRSLRDFMGDMDYLSGNLKSILDQQGFTECGAMVHVFVTSYPDVPFYTSADGYKMHSYLDSL